MELYPDNHLPPGFSGLFVSLWVGGLFLMLAYLLSRLRDARSREKAADGLYSNTSPLTRGDRWVAGTVELDAEVPFAARVEIRQKGEEQKSGDDVLHTWTETSRRSFSNPFWIRHASGERVLVEPAEEVDLVDKLDQTVHDEPRVRYRIAELSADETVVAEGTLDQERGEVSLTDGYRDAAATRWVLRTGSVERLYLSTDGIGARERRAVKQLLKRLFLVWLPSTLLTVVFLSGYLMRVFWGTHATALIEEKYTYETHTDDGTTTHCVVRYSIPGDPTQYREEIDVADYRDAVVGMNIAVNHVPSWPSVTSLGASPSVSAWFVLFIFLTNALFGAVWHWLSRKAWYESALKETGGGRLPQPKPGGLVYSRE